MRRALLVSTLALVGLAGACGTGESATVSAGATQLATMESDAATARRMVLSAADLPGYDVGTAADAGTTDTQAVSDFEACAGTAATLGGDGQSAVSPGFFRGRTVVVSSLAVVAYDPSRARAALADLSQARAAGCLTGLFRSVLGLDQLPGTAATTERLNTNGSDTGLRPPSDAVTWRTTIQVTSEAQTVHGVQATQTVSAYADLSFFRQGRAVGALFAFQIGEPFPARERTQLVSAMAGRTA